MTSREFTAIYHKVDDKEAYILSIPKAMREVIEKLKQ